MSPVIGVASWEVRPGPGLADVPLSKVDFPLGLPVGLEGGRLGDLGPEDHVIFYPKSGFYRPGALGIAAQASLVIAEPRAVHGWHMRLLPVFHRRFFRVLTRDRRLLARIPNGVFHNHTFAFVEDPEGVETAKSRACSLIASGKRDQEGHRLRHRIVETVRAEGLDIQIMGRGYAPFGRKEEGLAPFRYSVVIENSREPSYITEKLIDACLCRTVPIYWGAPDVAEWFDPAGLIVCESEAEIVEALRGLEGRDYGAFSAAIEANRQRALELMQGNRRAAERLLAEVSGG